MEWERTTTYIDAKICEVAGYISLVCAVLWTYLSVMSMGSQCTVRYMTDHGCVFQNLGYKPENENELHFAIM